MAESGYFVRVKGKIMGPYGIEALRRYAREGRLSRIHEISADRVQWNPAGEYEDLFPAATAAAASPSASPSPIRAAVRPQSAATAGRSVEPAAEIAVKPRPAAVPAARYYYAKDGTSFGPIAMSVLRLLAEKGTLQADDLVWQDGAQTSTPAAQVPALSAIYASRVDSPPEETPVAIETYAEPYTGIYADPQPQAAPTYAAPTIPDYARPERNVSTHWVSSIIFPIGIAAGALLVLCMVLPWASFAGETLWSWSFYKSAQTRVVGTVCMAVLLGGVALCILTPKTRGSTRGISFISVGGGGVLMILLALTSGGPGRMSMSWQFPFYILAFASLAPLVGVCFARPAIAHESSARLLLGIFSGVTTLGLLVLFLKVISNTRGTPSMDGAPGSIVFGAMLMFLGALAGLAAGILGLIGLRPRFSHSLNRVTWIVGLAGLGLPVLGMLVMVLGVLDSLGQLYSGQGPASAQASSVSTTVFFVFLRMILTWCALLAVLMIGMTEFLLSNAAKSRKGAV